MKKDIIDFLIFLDELPTRKLVRIAIVTGIAIGILAGFYLDLLCYLFGGFFE